MARVREKLDATLGDRPRGVVLPAGRWFRPPARPTPSTFLTSIPHGFTEHIGNSLLHRDPPALFPGGRKSSLP